MAKFFSKLVFLSAFLVSLFGVSQQVKADGAPLQYQGNYSYDYEYEDWSQTQSLHVKANNITLRRQGYGYSFTGYVDYKFYVDFRSWETTWGDPNDFKTTEIHEASALGDSYGYLNGMQLSLSVPLKYKITHYDRSGNSIGEEIIPNTAHFTVPLTVTVTGNLVEGRYSSDREKAYVVGVIPATPKPTPTPMPTPTPDDGCGVADINCSPDVDAIVDKGKDFATLKITRPTSKCINTSIDNGQRSDGKAVSDTYPIGTTTITWTATSRTGNKTTCPQKVIVNGTKLRDIPVIMKARGWVNASSLLDKWFNSKSCVANQTDGIYDFSIPVVKDVIDMAFVTSDKNGKKAYAKITNENGGLWKNNKRTGISILSTYKNNLINLLTAKVGQKIYFGSEFDADKFFSVENFHKQHVQHVDARSDRYASLKFPIELGTDQYSVLANYNIYAIPKGYAYIDYKKKVNIVVQEIAVYVLDSYDFNGTDNFGWWKNPNEFRPRVISSEDAGINATDQAFREYRDKTGFGGDFLLMTKPVVKKFSGKVGWKMSVGDLWSA